MLISRVLLESLIDLSDHSDLLLRELMDDLGLEVKSLEQAEGDSLYNLETLANRGDHASHHGVATELAGRLRRPVKFPPLAELPESPAGLPVRVLTPLCPRYTLLDLPSFRPVATDPKMAAMLKRLGAELYNQAVDVTNYVNLELGQPMHAFDRALVAGEVRVEELFDETEAVALDGRTYRVPRGALVICDAEKIIAIAGVIGCMNSRVTETTQGILLESALFDPVRVRTTARALKLSTRASFRFERGADRDMVWLAQRRALELLSLGVLLAAENSGATGAKPGTTRATGFTDVCVDQPELRWVALRLSELARELGCELGRERVEDHLSHLGFRLERAESDRLVWRVPAHRLWDVEAEQDLVEEVAKAFGYNQLPELMPSIVPGGPVLTARDELDERVQTVMVAAGFHEVIAPSLHGPELTEGLPVADGHPLGGFVTTTNSLESAFSTLRNSVVAVLCRILRENRARGVEDLKAFERGVVFSADPTTETGVAERWLVAAAAAGRWAPHNWRDKHDADYALMRGVVENLGDQVGVSFRFIPSEHPLLRPHARADIILENTTRVVGQVGMVHPTVAGELGSDVAYFEIELEPLLPFVERLPTYREPSPFPAASRDITWVVPDARSSVQPVAAQAIEETMRAAAGELCRGLELIDLYRPKAGGASGAFENHPKLTWRLTFQAPDRTLHREEVEEAMERVAEQVRTRLGLERG